MRLFQFGLIFPFPLTRASHNNSVCCAIQDSRVEGAQKLPAITRGRAEARAQEGPECQFQLSITQSQRVTQRIANLIFNGPN